MSADRKVAIKVLEETGSVIIRCNGNSMRPLIAPQEAIHLRKVDPSLLRVGDAVFCRIKGALQVHLLTAIDAKNQRYEISNNHDFRNGDIGPQSIFGLCVQVEDRVFVSEQDLVERAKSIQ